MCEEDEYARSIKGIIDKHMYSSLLAIVMSAIFFPQINENNVFIKEYGKQISFILLGIGLFLIIEFCKWIIIKIITSS